MSEHIAELIFFYTLLGDDICYRAAQFVGRNTPAIYSRIFHSRIFSAPPLAASTRVLATFYFRLQISIFGCTFCSQ